MQLDPVLWNAIPAQVPGAVSDKRPVWPEESQPSVISLRTIAFVRFFVPLAHMSMAAGCGIVALEHEPSEQRTHFLDYEKSLVLQDH